MKLRSGKRYPNRISKSRLFEVFLSFRDFGCEPEQYILDLKFIRQAELKGEKQCHWYKDNNGRLIVTNLSLLDDTKALEITNNGFKFIPIKHRVFISYAKEDLQYAKRLYDFLKFVGASPWLDEEALLPGQRWDIEIEAAIVQSNYFIALLSSRSVAKRGYVQEEIRRALDVLRKIPEREIFLIPARIDLCQPSHRVLEGIQWVDMFPDWDAGTKKVLLALGLSDIKRCQP